MKYHTNINQNIITAVHLKSNDLSNNGNWTAVFFKNFFAKQANISKAKTEYVKTITQRNCFLIC